MAGAALLPRVRTIVICDDASASLTEDGVFDLEGVRHRILADRFPHRASLNLYLLLASSRKGRYSGKIVLVDELAQKTIRYVKFTAVFQEDQQFLPLYIDVGNCEFFAAGEYNFEVYFSARGSNDVLKGEHPLRLLRAEE